MIPSSNKEPIFKKSAGALVFASVLMNTSQLENSASDLSSGDFTSSEFVESLRSSVKHQRQDHEALDQAEDEFSRRGLRDPIQV